MCGKGKMRIHYRSPDMYYFPDKLTGYVNKAEYLKIVHNYIKYYYRYAEIYRWWFLGLSSIKLLVLAAIPVIQVFNLSKEIKWIAAGGSSLCILLEALIQLYNMKDKWILYRKTGNDLMCEERWYITGTGKYTTKSEDESFGLFVESIEIIIGVETSEWHQMIKTIKTEKS